MKSPVFSIIIPSYNTEWSMFKKCADSIRNQSYVDFECIIIDDCSNDVDSAEKCAQYLKNDPRFIFLCNEKNEGVSFSRNKGIEKSRGKYIIFVDADDRIDESLLSKLYDNIEKKCPDTVFYEYARETNEKITPVFRNIVPQNCVVMGKNMVYQMIFSCDFNSPWNIMYSRSIIMENNLRFRPDVTMGEDFLFNIDYLKNMKKGSYIRENLYYYRNNPQSATNMFSTLKMMNSGEGYFARKKLLTDYFENDTQYGKLIAKLNSNYIVNIRNYVLSAVLDGYSDDEIKKYLDYPWIHEVLNGEVRGFVNNTMKYALRNKKIFMLRLLANLKKILGR